MEITVMMEKAEKTCISLQAKACNFIEKETLACGFCEILRTSFLQNTSVHSTSWKFDLHIVQKGLEFLN